MPTKGPKLRHQAAMTEFYSENAQRLFDQYSSISTADVHQDWLHLLPSTKLMILDVGAGSGRDAAWFADSGHEVIAVEPSGELRRQAQGAAHHPSIRWLDDSLPSLKEVYQLDLKFDLILLSAVWNHIPAGERERSFRKVANLLKPGGKLVISLRHGPSPDRRFFYETSAEEVLALAKRFMLATVLQKESPDRLGRPEVHWTVLVFGLPDDGTEALPLLRHVIINDPKASTYKLGLLRVLLRIADGTRGMVIDKDEKHVTIPFGLVALFWTRIYKRLILEKMINQHPQGKHGFVREDFSRLRDISPYDLRIGARFEGQTAKDLTKALRDVRNLIKRMPAFYTTYPNSESTVFQCDAPPVRVDEVALLDRDFLLKFGIFKIPTDVWESMSRYSCWIEPAIIKEWCSLMSGYETKQGRQRPLEVYVQSLSWLDAERSTAEVRGLVDGLLEKGKRLFCVWTGSSLSRGYQVDHCFPFSYWQNNDLWNLFPAHSKVNERKSDKIPSARLLEKASERILQWWSEAYGAEPFRERFFLEARASLPIGLSAAANSYESVFSGLQLQRQKLKIDQQIREWDGLGSS